MGFEKDQGQMPDFPHVEAARRYSEAALASITEFGLVPTPQNYAILYAYHDSRQPDLTQTIDRLRATGEAITQEASCELYREFCESYEPDAVLDAAKRMASAIQLISTSISRAGNDTARYGDALTGIGGSLFPDASHEQVHDAVKNLLAETRVMQMQNGKFQQRLQESNKEIDSLQQNLVAARKEATTDSLTGLMNRRFIDDALVSAAKECVASSEPLSLLMLDVDHFKKFNDTYGHQLGDVVLKQVAQSFTTNTKGQDIVGRFGGEEFMIILPRTDLSGAVVVGEQILTNVASKRIVLKSSGKSLGKITLSGGAATLAAGEVVSDLLKRADEALYSAKSSGRNRIVSELSRFKVRRLAPTVDACLAVDR